MSSVIDRASCRVHRPVDIWPYVISPSQDLCLTRKCFFCTFGKGAPFGPMQLHRCLAWQKGHGLHFSSCLPLWLGALVQWTACTTLCHPWLCYCFILGNQTLPWFGEKTESWKSQDGRSAVLQMHSQCLLKNRLGQASRHVVTRHHCILAAIEFPKKACLGQR